LLDVTTDDELQIIPAQNTMSNCYDIILKNEDYTIGKAIEYMFYAKYFNDTQILTYCGFKKMHPHDSDSIVRVAYKDVVDKAMIKGHLEICIESLTQILDKIKKMI
jgi:DNA-directed RNA polymerase subunit L